MLVVVYGTTIEVIYVIVIIELHVDVDQ